MMAACEKVRHRSERDAHEQMVFDKRTGRENKKRANRLNVYFCVRCGAWHVGHNPFKGKQYRHANSGLKMRSATGRV